MLKKWLIQSFSYHKCREPDHGESGKLHRVAISRVILRQRKVAKHRNVLVLKLFSEISADRWKE